MSEPERDQSYFGWFKDPFDPDKWAQEADDPPSGVCPNCGEQGDHKADGLFRKGYLCQPPSTPESRRAKRVGALAAEAVVRLEHLEQSTDKLGLDPGPLVAARHSGYRAMVACAEAAGDLRCPNCNAVGQPGHHFMDTEEFIGFICEERG